MEIVIVWGNKALQQFDKQLEFIAIDSPMNAYAVLVVVRKQFEKAVKNPHIFPADKYKKDNDNSYRAFEIKKLRFSYRIKSDRLLVLRCRHTKMKPTKY